MGVANMVFYPPPWVPKLPEIPDTVPICEFMLDEKYGRRPYSDSWDAYTCGLSGKSITARQQKENVDKLARALAKEFGWKVNEGTEYDKVVGVFALNTIDIMSLSWAIHRINGVSSPAAQKSSSRSCLCSQRHWKPPQRPTYPRTESIYARCRMTLLSPKNSRLCASF